MEVCKFCNGTLKSKFVDMSKVPEGTSMIMGDETWKQYEEEEDCVECHGLGLTSLPSNLFEKQKALKLLSN
jgi:hypothetical protein